MWPDASDTCVISSELGPSQSSLPTRDGAEPLRAGAGEAPSAALCAGGRDASTVLSSCTGIRGLAGREAAAAEAAAAARRRPLKRTHSTLRRPGALPDARGLRVIVMTSEEEENSEAIMQVRRAIGDTRSRKFLATQAEVAQRECDDDLEDAILGNDFLLNVALTSSKHERRALQGVMHGSSVAVTQPSELAAVSAALLSAEQVAALVDTPCLAMKPYQVAALAFWACRVQRGVRGCVLADPPRLGRRILVAGWISMLRSIGHYGTSPHRRGSGMRVRHMLSFVIAPDARLASWQHELRRWAPSFSIMACTPDSAGAVFQALQRHADALEAAGFLDGEGDVPARGSADAPPQGPWDVLLLPHSLFETDSSVHRPILERLSWRLAVLEKPSKVGRDVFKHMRLLLGRAHLRLALEDAPPGAHLALPALQNLCEFVLPGVFDDGYSDPTSLAACSPAASAQEADKMAEVLAPFTLARTPDAVLPQWGTRHHMQEMVNMAEAQCGIYRQCVANAFACLSRQSGQALSAPPTPLPRHHQHLSVQAPTTMCAFSWMYSVAQHPTLVRAHYSHDTLRSLSLAAAAVDAFGDGKNANELYGSLRMLSDLKISQLCSSHPQLQRFALPVAYLLSSGKCQALLQILQRLTAGAACPVVLASAYPAMLDVFEVLLRHLGLPGVRIDETTTAAAAAAAASRFAETRGAVALLQTDAVTRLPPLDLSCAGLCILHDSGLDVPAEAAVEASCMSVDRRTVLPLYKLITTSTVDEKLAYTRQQGLAGALAMQAGAQRSLSPAALVNTAVLSELRLA